MRTPGFLALALLAALAPSAPARAAEPRTCLVLERTVREFGPRPPAGKDNGPETAELSARHYTVKMAPAGLRESCRETGGVTIVRFDKGLVWTLDTKAKTYRELSFQKLSALAERARKRVARRLPLVENPRHNARHK